MKLLGIIFNQRLRQTERFVKSIIKLMDLNLMVSDYSTLYRRVDSIHVPNLSSMLEESSEPIYIAIDFTGLTVYRAVSGLLLKTVLFRLNLSFMYNVWHRINTIFTKCKIMR